MKRDKYVQWIIVRIVGELFKDDMQTIAIMPQRLAKMPTPNMWDEIKGERFGLIDGQHNVEATKKIQNMDKWADPYGHKTKLRVCKTLVI